MVLRKGLRYAAGAASFSFVWLSDRGWSMFPSGFSVEGLGGLDSWACGLEKMDKGRGRLRERMRGCIDEGNCGDGCAG